jgi:hypothetical protein
MPFLFEFGRVHNGWQEAQLLVKACHLAGTEFHPVRFRLTFGQMQEVRALFQGPKVRDVIRAQDSDLVCERFL